ncbi:ferredoxin reductase [Dactylosporangium aurantiacum]|uniref:Ferredoxin reductase n=1 Tax=Dactylosporangium aurantiacum TaxID=35754 RepID=A0A9Q9IEP4_9ACTN|nr:ferredoxin reductase [Dactylosporangium aurantiacum]MDG6101495.1 ferredoxin reductase [Dactylosporangium aurantiacum]UWZ52657.1 ferredoxin reductase [Dactylosporangium aurantiacum]
MAATQALRAGAWRVVELLTTPLVPGDYLDVVAPLRNREVLRAKVVGVRHETDRAVTLTLRPGRGWRRHQPGQYLRLGVDVDGVRLWRAYSLTSSPDRRDGLLTVTVTGVDGGAVSGHLLRRARPGMLLGLERPAGDFTVPPRAPAKALFVTAGSGLTPIMGILRGTALRDVVLVHSARSAQDVLFAGELRDLARDGRIRLVERHTGSDGRITPADLVALVPDIAERDTWACGPNDMLDELAAYWTAAGLAGRLHVERFRPAVVAAGDGGTVTFLRSGPSVEAGGGTPLLEAGEAAGVLMPSGCRMGICFGCVLPLREGAVRDLRDGRVTTATAGDDVLVQTCVNAAAGDCHLDV